ncbi:MAG: MFS transporter [Anaerolineae bacterium]
MIKRHLLRSLKLSLPVCLLLVLVAFPTTALAHGDGGREASAIAGPAAWGFLGFGALVIGAVSVILFTGRPDRRSAVRAANFGKLTGFGGYIAKMRLFSRNARLFMVHVVGMDVIYGTWHVLFNLYLLAVGFDVAFIGLRILLSSAAAAVASIPAGMISDRIGRKLSFILGDGVGAAMSLIAISTTNPTLLLGTAVVGGIFAALHGVAEPAFMAENSESFERVHLFSVSDGTRTAAAIIGSALAGLVPLVFAGVDQSARVELYRLVAYIGIGGWFASLIPAIMLRRTATVRATNHARGRRVFANVKHPGRIWRLTAPEVLIGFGAGFALPLMNVFFNRGLDSPEVEIGATFAAGQAFLVVGSFLAPLVAVRLGKVNSVVFTRMASIPFILLIAFSPDVGSVIGSVLTVAGLAYVARITLMNMASPVRSAFGMEILDPEERSTQVGIQLALSSAVSGLASYAGAQLMNVGDFRTPFLLMAGFYLAANLLFWIFFAGREKELALVLPIEGAKVVVSEG